MSEPTEDEEVTPRDIHVTASPGDDAAAEDAQTTETDEQPAATGDDTPIKPLDDHIP